MDKDQLKEYLLDNPNKIEDVLENIGCHHIKIIKNKRVQSALPEGDNNESVQIYLNEYLSAIIYTKNEFDNCEIKDIYAVIQFIKECTFREAINIVSAVCGIEYSSEIKKINKSSSYDFLKKFIRSVKKEEWEDDSIILNENFLERFIRVDCVLYLEDGVNSATQEKFNISYDVLDNRVVFPIRNDDGLLISFKGRTCNPEYKIRGIPKFINYYPCSNNNYLFGYYENKNKILSSNELFVLESEKAIFQMDSLGINNAIAISKKVITERQLTKLLKLGKSIILALDKDVSLEGIFIECKKFKGLCPVFYIFDTLDLLHKKDSPVDQGLDISYRLYTECKFEYKGE